MNRLVIPENLDDKISEAVAAFWSTRNQQIKKQNESDSRDQGNRGAVTGGKQLDGFVKLIKDILMLNGVKEESVFINSNLELPGYYRPNKKWDLLVVENNQLIIAIEFKSQVGPSFGNNFNNRTEEAMGSALDIWTAYREGVFGTHKAPWVGYFMILEDCNSSSVPVKVSSPHFDVLEEFVDASYRKRYELFCNKLVLERQYSSVCFMTTSNTNDKPQYSCPDINLSYVTFISSMAGAVMSYLAERRI